MWEEWSQWEECNVTCAGGLQSRYRDCIGTAFGGQNCTGPSSETRECNTQFCPGNVDNNLVLYFWSVSVHSSM